MASESTTTAGGRSLCTFWAPSVRCGASAVLIAVLATGLVAGCSDHADPSAASLPTTGRSSSTTSTSLPGAGSGSTDGTAPVDTPSTKPEVPTTAGHTTSTDAPTTLFGTVTATPTCPVERPGQTCAPAPVSGTVQALDAGGQIVGQAPTDSTGHYDMPVAPGTYTLHVAVGAVLPRCPDTPAAAPRGARTKVDIGCDTGMR